MSRLELTTRAYWAAAVALNRRQSPADRAMLEDTLHMIATNAHGRVAEAAAKRLEEPFVLGDDDTFDFNGLDGGDAA